MEFRQLEYFCTISELENFTRTAEVLHVSQPSVTKAIKALEAELGLQLIDRSQKRASLTEEGKAFLLHARRVMQDVMAAKQDMQRFRHDTHGTVRFGMPPMVEAYLFPDFFTKFRQAFPDVALDLQEFNDSEEVRSQANLGELDFGIVQDSGLEAENEICILRDQMSVCLPADHELASREALSFEDLAGEKFILQQPRTYQYKAVLECCQAAGFMPEVLLCTSQLKTIKQLVANRMGISILPEFVTHTEKTFVRRPLAKPLEVVVSLYWCARKPLSMLGDRFKEFMRQYTATPEFKRHYRQA